MRRFSGVSFLLANFLFVVLGCSGGAPAPKVDESPVGEPHTANKPPIDAPASSGAKPYKPKSGGKQEAGQVIQATYSEELPASEMPKVQMSVGHAAMCKVKVGDAFPDAALADLAGKQKKLSELRGQKLTVVLLWSDKLVFGREALADMLSTVLTPYQKLGVNVVAIDVNDPAATVAKAASAEKDMFPVLLDPKGDYFAKVGTGKLPRIYLLDPQGKILWFDIEYGRTVRRDLQQAIRFKLGLAKKTT